MTTIVWDGRVLAADSQTTDTSCATDMCTRKIAYHKERGMLFAMAGHTPHKIDLYDWATAEICEDKRYRIPGGEWDLIVIKLEADGHARLFNGYNSHSIDNIGHMEEQFNGRHTTGSGRSYGLGALLAGMDSVKCVDIASQVDVNTGGLIEWFDTATMVHSEHIIMLHTKTPYEELGAPSNDNP